MKEKTKASHVPEYKKKNIEELVSKLKASRSVLIASMKGLPSSQFHSIKKKLRGVAEIKVAKKSALIRAIEKTEKGALQNLKEQISADSTLFFSDMDAFELSALLEESQSPAKAKSGDIAPEDISIEPGPTDLVPGPAISELSGVGLKVAVENGKLTIKKGAVVAKEGEPIKENVAGVLGKLGISPMKAGFEPLAAYDSVSDKVYTGIKINKKEKIEELRNLIGKAFGFAVNLEYATKETIGRIIVKAGLGEIVLLNKINKNSSSPSEEVKEGEKK